MAYCSTTQTRPPRHTLLNELCLSPIFSCLPGLPLLRLCTFTFGLRFLGRNPLQALWAPKQLEHDKIWVRRAC
jgi:hypothetical protein